MSTKIYSGFRFTTRSWTTVHKHIMAFRSELKILVNNERARQIAEHACLAVDRRAAGFHDGDGRSAYVLAIKKHWDEEKVFPVKFDIAVFPHGQRIYGITFGWPPYETLWQSKLFVQAWGYWNNTDKPDEVSAEEWRYRRKVWDKILGNSSPAMTGFVAQCIDTYDTHVGPEAIVENAPEFDARVRITAADLMFPEYKKEHGGEGLDCFMKFQKWVQGAGSEKFQAECERVKPLLPRRITSRMLVDG